MKKQLPIILFLGILTAGLVLISSTEMSLSPSLPIKSFSDFSIKNALNMSHAKEALKHKLLTYLPSTKS